MSIIEPTDEEMAEYLNGEHGPPHPEVVRIIQDDLERAVRGEDA